jgi:hypothetical protein
MRPVTLQAHLDGRQIVLEEAHELPRNTSLMLTVLPLSAETGSEGAWLRAAASSGAFEVLADPAEDIYTTTDGEPFRDAM